MEKLVWDQLGSQGFSLKKFEGKALRTRKVCPMVARAERRQESSVATSTPANELGNLNCWREIQCVKSHLS